tara:strand:- start:918 stop:2171 length:1254 start_codon:yes stop_codon:yes gene_type:complete
LDKKIKVLVLSDHPLSPSGVGTQTRYMIEALLKTGKFQFVCFGGAITHVDYKPQKTEEWGDDWIIWPIDGYGSPDLIRSMIRQQKPDILWFMTDPRFWTWLWEMDHEVRPFMPMVYYHVWDNYPYPYFNKKYYDSNDVIATISKVTDDIVKTVSPTIESHYIPHAVDSEIFKNLGTDIIENFKKSNMSDPDKFVFFWNNRNARRKLSGSVVYWFKEFLDRVGKDKAMLLMHTDTKDPHGQDLDAIVKSLGLDDGSVMFSRDKIEPEKLALLYNMADCTINVSDAEGFGLATLESLSCETPIIVNMTGGLQEQVTDGEQWFGIGIEPASKSVIGSQDVPWIHEDRVSKEDFVNALEEMYRKSPEERTALGKKGREHVMKNYNFATFNDTWVNLMLNVHEKHGSWDSRKEHKTWEMIKL